MFCEKCGAQMPDNARFCPKCGASYIDDPAPASDAPGPAPQPSPTVNSYSYTPPVSISSDERMIKVYLYLAIAACALRLIGVIIEPGLDYSIDLFDILYVLLFGALIFLILKGSGIERDLVRIFIAYTGIVFVAGIFYAIRGHYFPTGTFWINTIINAAIAVLLYMTANSQTNPMLTLALFCLIIVQAVRRIIYVFDLFSGDNGVGYIFYSLFLNLAVICFFSIYAVHEYPRLINIIQKK